MDQVKEFGYRYIDTMSSSANWVDRYENNGQIDDLKKMLDVKAEHVKRWAEAIGSGEFSPSLSKLANIMILAAGSRSDLAYNFVDNMDGRIFKGTNGRWGVSR